MSATTRTWSATSAPRTRVSRWSRPAATDRLRQSPVERLRDDRRRHRRLSRHSRRWRPDARRVGGGHVAAGRSRHLHQQPLDVLDRRACAHSSALASPARRQRLRRQRARRAASRRRRRAQDRRRHSRHPHPDGHHRPGSGLGVSSVVPVGRALSAVPGEGGHVTMAPADDEESAVLALLRHRYDHVSAERVLSGSRPRQSLQCAVRTRRQARGGADGRANLRRGHGRR